MAQPNQKPIKIKPSHRGLFTEKARKAGMSPMGYASKVMSNPRAYPKSTVKQANFAKNFGGKGK